MHETGHEANVLDLCLDEIQRIAVLNRQQESVLAVRAPSGGQLRDRALRALRESERADLLVEYGD